ncbi:MULTISPECIES: hypothetical protein [unclassified Lysobacter]|uniref:hypothetical protein n=1 Tax=unclassified Lysobacter TaxID=2635362 RepID=UPI001BEB27E3|nr:MULTISPECIES: hypothetical protein [unclassified Lysobacter]MBT2748018.1 hypothetical protein [Lysobacter sp. ISL-42]MBT2752770.1 hypothetical protein [Lysobacter sp. ISL-50]MBT2779358.1 hypothetical protein [Lysobacter sp. ISL-54]MBT2781914.1 hypothetical protein [Lysobacter sp. ISL-52]
MSPARRAGRFALPAASLAALLALAGCGGDDGNGGAAAGADKKAAPADAAAASADPATDPALNWGGTSPHDTPPLDPLIEQADAIVRKADPGFDHFDVDHFVGDLDRDGRNDVVIEYGIGEEGAMRHVAKRVRVLLARKDGLQLQPDQTDVFADCPQVRGIRDGRLWVDGLEACMLPFPRTLGYYAFEWDGKALRRVVEETPEQRVIAQLQAMRLALQAGRDSEVAAHLRPAPAAADKNAAEPEAVFADAQRRRAFIDTVGMLSHAQLSRIDEHRRFASVAPRGGAVPGERALQIDLAPDGATAEVAGGSYVIDATAMLQWPQSGGVGYHMNFRLIEGELYLADHEEHDLGE